MTIIDIINDLKSSDFLLNCNMQMGYAPGLPMLTRRVEKPCILVPFLRYQIVGQVDRTRVYPPRYVVTLTAKEGRVVAFEDLAFDARFAKINFHQPVGFFRHPAVQILDKNEYQAKRHELLALINKLRCSMLDAKVTFNGADAARLNKLYALLLEPSVKPFYHALCKEFFERHIAD